MVIPCVTTRNYFSIQTIIHPSHTGRQRNTMGNYHPPNPTRLPKKGLQCNLKFQKFQDPQANDTIPPGICTIQIFSSKSDSSFPLRFRIQKADHYYPPRLNRYSLRTPTLVLATTSSLLFSCRMPIILKTSSLARMRVGSKGRRWDWFRRTSAMTCCGVHVSLRGFSYNDR